MEEEKRVHLGELVWRTTGDLGNSEKSKLSLQLLQLHQQVRLSFSPQLMNLDSRCCIFTSKTQKNGSGNMLLPNRRNKIKYFEFHFSIVLPMAATLSYNGGSSLSLSLKETLKTERA